MKANEQITMRNSTDFNSYALDPECTTHSSTDMHDSSPLCSITNKTTQGTLDIMTCNVNN
jgi:hypothetical protein